MANLEPMPISSLPEGDIQDGDKAIIYRESTGKAYQTGGFADLQKEVEELNADLTDNLDGVMGYFSSFDALNSKVCEQSYRPIIFTCSGSAVSSVLSNGAVTSMGLGIAACNNGSRTQWVYLFTASGNRAFMGSVLNGEVTVCQQLSASSVLSASSTGDPVVMGEDD